jgi:hypothetical protein
MSETYAIMVAVRRVRLLAKASPTKPRPNIAQVDGSGTLGPEAGGTDMVAESGKWRRLTQKRRAKRRTVDGWYAYVRT